MKYIVFGDESTLPELKKLLYPYIAKYVIASNRFQAIECCGDFAITQPKRNTIEYKNFLEQIRLINPDLFICFSYSMILGKELLQIPKYGSVNIHGALLPKYRGANALNWVIINGEPETGVTAHFMTEIVDGGPIILQETTPIFDHDDAVTLKKRLDNIGMEMILKIHKKLIYSKKLNSKVQDYIDKKPLKRRVPDDGLIKWQEQSDLDIFNLVRALVSPWPGAFFFDKSGNKIILDKPITLDAITNLRKKYAP
jgi:methionyl-tRNA formyltransferase